MANIFIFADETGDLGYNLISGSKHFGFGTATIFNLEQMVFFDAFRLRCNLEEAGVHIRSGFHAQQDSNYTKQAVFTLIRKQAPRLDFTFLDKQGISGDARLKGDLHLYKLAWFLHFTNLAKSVANANDTIFAITASLKTKAKTLQIREALGHVASEVPDRRIIPVYWDSSSSWGLQMADYALWAAQRHVLNLSNHWWEKDILPNTRTLNKPLG